MWPQVVTYHLSVVLARLVGQERRGREAGQSMVEYAIIAALIAVVAMVAIQALGAAIADLFQKILAHIQSIGG